MTIRRYQRSLLATTCTEMGAIYCSIISFATETSSNEMLENTVPKLSSDSPTGREKEKEKEDDVLERIKLQRKQDVMDINASLAATRSKLNRSAGLLTNIVYEFSLRGRWPRERYQQILDLQM